MEDVKHFTPPEDIARRMKEMNLQTCSCPETAMVMIVVLGESRFAEMDFPDGFYTRPATDEKFHYFINRFICHEKEMDSLLIFRMPRVSVAWHGSDATTNLVLDVTRFARKMFAVLLKLDEEHFPLSFMDDDDMKKAKGEISDSE